MKCINHSDADAVGSCAKCGAGLCKSCFKKYNNHVCDDCAKEITGGKVADAQFNLVRTIVLSIIGAIAFTIYNSQSGEQFSPIVAFWLGAGIPWGWSVLNMITPNIFLFMPLIGWVIYFIIKFALALMVGAVAMPIKIIILIVHYSNAKKVDANIKNEQNKE